MIDISILFYGVWKKAVAKEEEMFYCCENNGFRLSEMRL